MSKASFIQYLLLTRFTGAKRNRQLYRQVCQMRATRIVEIGLGHGERALNLISLAQRFPTDKPIRFTGIDLFEARPHDPSFSLKRAHQLLHGEGYEVRLVPGDPASALARCANDLRGTDLIVVSEGSSAEVMAVAHFLNRMLHKDSQIWLEQQGKFKVLGPADLRSLGPGRRAA